MYELGNASVDYGDMRGTAALDFKDGMITDISKKLDVPGFPIAVELHHGWESMPPQEPELLKVDVFATTVAAGADALQQYAADHGNRIPTTCYERKMTLADFADVVKRFNVVLRWRVVPDAKIDYEYANEDD